MGEWLERCNIWGQGIQWHDGRRRSCADIVGALMVSVVGALTVMVGLGWEEEVS